jgi:hypothetical protein
VWSYGAGLVLEAFVARHHHLLLLVLGACGGGGESPGPDGDLPDCGLLFCTPPPPPNGPITVQISDGGAPVSGVQVVFIDELGTTSSTVTDAAGSVTQFVELGASVTVINPFGATKDVDDVRTIADAKPFDVFDLTNNATPVTVTMTLTGFPHAGAASYQLRTPCGDLALASPSGEITLPRCGTTVDMLLLSLDASGTPIGAMSGAFALEAGGTISLGSNYNAVPEVRVEYTGVDRFDEIAGTVGLLGDRGRFYDRAFDADIASAIGTGRVLLPRSTGHTTLVESRPVPLADDLAQHGIIDWNPANTGDRIFIDLFNSLMPSVITPPQVESNRIVWGEGFRAASVVLESSIPDAPGPEEAGTFVVFELGVTRGPKSWTWTLMSRQQGTVLPLPAIPTEHAIASGDTVAFDRMLLANVTGGYDNVRRLLLDKPNLTDLVVSGFQTGRIVYQELR